MWVNALTEFLGHHPFFRAVHLSFGASLTPFALLLGEVGEATLVG